MGWGSATHLFDAAVDVALIFAPKITNIDTGETFHSEDTVRAVVEAMYTKVDWDDWDTQDESRYWKYLARIMFLNGEIEEYDYIQLQEGGDVL